MYRHLTREEKTMLNRFFDKWGMFDYFKDKSLLIKENTDREVYLMNDEVRKLALKQDPVLAGIKLGDMKKQFWLSIECAAIFAKYSNKRRVVVSEQAEALVLYGRDVFGDSIVNHTDDFGENEIVLIINRNGEAIGIGRTRFPSEKITKSGVTITTIADRGIYLREEDSATL